VDPENEAILKLVDFAGKNAVTTGVFTIGDEKEFNVFMRTNSEAVRGEFVVPGRRMGLNGMLGVEKTGSNDPIKNMEILRDLKVSLCCLLGG
jgi:hypothetical protein